MVRTDSSSMTSTVGLASVDPVQVSGSVVALTLDTAVPPGDTVTVGYTVPTGTTDAMPVQDTAGNALEWRRWSSGGGQRSRRPRNARRRVDPGHRAGGPPASLNATPGDTQATLTWTAPTSDGGSAVTGYQYRYKTSGEFPDSWTDVPDGSDTGTDRSDERSYTVTGWTTALSTPSRSGRSTSLEMAPRPRPRPPPRLCRQKEPYGLRLMRLQLVRIFKS